MKAAWASLLVVAVLSCGFATTIVHLLTRSRLVDYFADQPNHRSLHEKPVPRIGGIAIIISICLGFALLTLLASTGLSIHNRAGWMAADPALAVLMTGVVVLCVVGAVDDLRDLSALTRACVQLLCAGALSVTWLVSNSPTPPGELPVFMALGMLVLWPGILGWCANLFNFMDGSDGIAGAMAVAGFGAMAVMAPPNTATAMLAAASAGASAGFLVYNWHPARVFMGDAGSVPLGFLAAGLGIHGVLVNYWAIWFPIACFLPFLFDATATLILRIKAGHRPWQAHREHAYQRLILAGYGHQAVALGFFVLGAASSVVAATIRYQNGYVFFTAWTVIMMVHAGLFWWARQTAHRSGSEQ
jgi:UDP-N-acetylmuramyl pentapeptide phosphotransferase/UDP-N-acetylglucosamine-1-phosphate transferase